MKSLLFAVEDTFGEEEEHTTEELPPGKFYPDQFKMPRVINFIF